MAATKKKHPPRHPNAPHLPSRERRQIHRIENPPTPKGQSQPPAFSYDPAIEAQREAAQRGATDLIKGTYRTRRRTRADFATTKSDILLKQTRGRQDLGTQLRQGLLSLRQKTQDTRLGLARGEEDYGSALGNLVAKTRQAASTQTQQANAAGFADAGTLAASEAARSQAFARARQPLDTKIGRLRADTATNVQRLGIQRGQLHREVHRGYHRLGQDVGHDLTLARRDRGRTIADANTQLQQGLREQQLGDVAYRNEEIYNARENFPGAFSTSGVKTGKRVPYLP